MTPDSFDPEALADAMAPLLGLTLTPESRAETIVHLRIAAEQAEKLLSISLDDSEEPAPVFTRVTAALLDGSAQAIAAAVRTGAASAREIARGSARAASRPATQRSAPSPTSRRRARSPRRTRSTRPGARGESLGPLAGAPFAVKNLFDIEGLPTRAGSKINRDRPPAAADATVIARLEAAGGVLIGALNMGEYAYDFTGQNAHDGPSRNPHDLEHMTGGSSGGSGGGGRRRPRSDRAGIGHQRLHPRAELVLRLVRPQADLWPAVARRRIPVRRQSRSSGAVRAIGRRSCARL